MAQNRRPGSVLIAEENPLFRQGLKALFASDAGFAVVGEAADGSSALQQIREIRPRALVISADLLRQSEGLRLSTAIRQAMPELRILVMASENSEVDVAAAISCGAKGMVLKSGKPGEFLAALHKVMFEEGGMSWAGLIPDMQALSEQTSPQKNSSVLTAREQEVVRLLAEGKTVRVVAHDLSLSVKTIEAHKLNLMRKLDIHNRVSLVAYANRNGMVATAGSAH